MTPAEAPASPRISDSRGTLPARRDDPPRILVIKLSDFGDALLTRPALAQLRLALPAARIDVLSTPIGAQAYRHMGLADRVLVFDRSARNSPAALLGRLGAILDLARKLRAARYDAVALLHSLTTRRGAIKQAGLVLATGAGLRVGLRRPGSPRGAFLNHAAEDLGFDARHVVEAGEAVARCLLEAMSPAGLARPAAPEGLAISPVSDASASFGPLEIQPSRGPSGSDHELAGPAPSSRNSAASWRVAAPRHLDFQPGREAELLARDLLAPLEAEAGQSAGPLVALHPGSGGFSLARRWSPAGFAAVADGLRAEGARLVLVGQASDDSHAVRAAMVTEPALDLTDHLDLAGLAAVLARMQLLIANDSGVMHLATAVDTPVLAIFGPSNPVAWGPWWPGTDRQGRPAASPHRLVRLGLSCQPCLYRGYRLGSREGCPSRDCLAWLGPDRVLSEARALLRNSEDAAGVGPSGGIEPPNGVR